MGHILGQDRPQVSLIEDQHPAVTRTAELARYKLGRISRDDKDGYRIQCPAATGKIRCPLRPASMTRDRDRPEILARPDSRRPSPYHAWRFRLMASHQV
jgi:hypothetical protein